MNFNDFDVFDDFDNEIKSYKTYYVLWVKHCEACSNQLKKEKSASLKRRLITEPLCTKVGMIQALVFGRELETIINNFPNYIKYAIRGIGLYSSVLPCAVETAKLISIQNMHLMNKPISRMLYIQERKSTYEKILFPLSSSTNMTTLQKSNCHIKLLNNIIGGAKIHNWILGCDNNTPCNIFKAESTDHENWKKNILPLLDSSKLNIIVSHHDTIKNNVLKFTKKKINFDNLHAALVEYKYDIPTKKITEKYITKVEVDPSKYYSKMKILNNKYFTCSYDYENDIKSKYCNK